MELVHLDHVNVRTANIERLKRFYCDVLGLAEGPRPPLASRGAWLYLGERAVVHLIELDEPAKVSEVRLEHFAFRARGLADLLARFDALGVAYRTAVIPKINIGQVHAYDPDGNHVEIGFDAPEDVGALRSASR